MFLEAKREFLPENAEFDHLYGEYVSLASTIPDGTDKTLLEEIYRRRQEWNLSWNSVYTFELILLKHLPPEKLRHKILSLRSKYLSIAGQKKYDAYLASRPTYPPAPPATPAVTPATTPAVTPAVTPATTPAVTPATTPAVTPATTPAVTPATTPAVTPATTSALTATPAVLTAMPPPPPPPPPGRRDPAYPAYVEALQEEARYLLDEVYLLYAVLPAREGLGKWLTIWTAAPLVVLVAIIVVLFIWLGDRNILLAFVFLAGATGGFISMLQRLQTQAGPADGDPIYNLSAFWHGAYGLFLSPLNGAIFAVILFLMFTGHVLQGRFFPEMATLAPPEASPSPTSSPKPPTVANASPTVSPATTPSTPAPTVTPTATATASPAATTTASPGASVTVATSPSVHPTVSPSPTRTPSDREPSTAQASGSPPTNRLSFRDFVSKSAPKDGENYALLLVWCFIAGFAERFVPDTLSRLVAQKSDQSGKNAS